MNATTQKIEAMLFLAGTAVAKAELCQRLDISVEGLEEHLRELANDLADHGLALVVTDSHAQLTTSPAVASWVQAFIQEEIQNLSAASAETLAIIAYRGPVTRLDVDAIRGVESRRIIQQLLSRGLIQKETKPRGSLYTIAPEFLTHLGLRTRADLPRFAELSQDAKINAILDEHRTRLS